MGVSHLSLSSSPARSFSCLPFLTHHGSLDLLLPIPNDLDRAVTFLTVLLLLLLKCYPVPY